MDQLKISFNVAIDAEDVTKPSNVVIDASACSDLTTAFTRAQDYMKFMSWPEATIKYSYASMVFNTTANQEKSLAHFKQNFSDNHPNSGDMVGGGYPSTHRFG